MLVRKKHFQNTVNFLLTLHDFSGKIEIVEKQIFTVT